LLLPSCGGLLGLGDRLRHASADWHSDEASTQLRWVAVMLLSHPETQSLLLYSLPQSVDTFAQ